MTAVLIAAVVVTVWLLLAVLRLTLARAAGRADRVLGAEAARHAQGLRALGRAARR